MLSGIIDIPLRLPCQSSIEPYPRRMLVDLRESQDVDFVRKDVVLCLPHSSEHDALYPTVQTMPLVHPVGNGVD